MQYIAISQLDYILQIQLTLTRGLGEDIVDAVDKGLLGLGRTRKLGTNHRLTNIIDFVQLLRSEGKLEMIAL